MPRRNHVARNDSVAARRCLSPPHQLSSAPGLHRRAGDRGGLPAGVGGRGADGQELARSHHPARGPGPLLAHRLRLYRSSAGLPGVAASGTLDIALDAVLATLDKRPAAHKFCWTAETTVAVDDWWQAADAERRWAFLCKRCESGSWRSAALPLNQTPTLNRRQWQTMLALASRGPLAATVQPHAALQDDVNGFPRAGAMALLDRGVHYLFSGINRRQRRAAAERALGLLVEDARRPRSSSSGWAIPIPNGILLLRRRGLAPRARAGRHRHALSPAPARRNLRQPTRPRSARPTQRLLTRSPRLGGRAAIAIRPAIALGDERMADGQRSALPAAGGVRGRVEPPGLEADAASDHRCGGHAAHGRRDRPRGPGLRRRMDRLVGQRRGFRAARGRGQPAGQAAGRRRPHRRSGARWTARPPRPCERIYRDLCLFDEHTWGSTSSVALPDDLETIGQYNEKSRYAYRPVGLATSAPLAAGSHAAGRPGRRHLPGQYGPSPWSGWVTVPADSLGAITSR